MNIEGREKRKSAREILHSFEEEGKYLFHGSPYLVDELQPRQPKEFNKDTGENQDHGKSGVCASVYSDFAIFRALGNDANIEGEHTSSFGTENDGSLKCTISENALEAIKDKSGYVYVVKKDDFPDAEGWERRVDKIVKPEEVVQVTFEDLPMDITEIIKDEEE